MMLGAQMTTSPSVASMGRPEIGQESALSRRLLDVRLALCGADWSEGWLLADRKTGWRLADWGTG